MDSSNTCATRYIRSIFVYKHRNTLAFRASTRKANRQYNRHRPMIEFLVVQYEFRMATPDMAIGDYHNDVEY